MINCVSKLFIGLSTCLLFACALAQPWPKSAADQQPVAYLKNVLAIDQSQMSNKVLIDRITQQFDMPYFCKVVIPKTWDQLDQQQKIAFQRIMKKKIAHTLQFIFTADNDRKIAFAHMTFWKHAPIVVISTRLQRPGWQDYPIDYYLYKQGNHYRLVDMRIFGNSLIFTYHMQLLRLLKQYPWSMIMQLLQGQRYQ